MDKTDTLIWAVPCNTRGPLPYRFYARHISGVERTVRIAPVEYFALKDHGCTRLCRHFDAHGNPDEPWYEHLHPAPEPSKEGE